MLSTMSSNDPDLEALAEFCLQSAKTTKAFLATSGNNRLVFDTQALATFPKYDNETERVREATCAMPRRPCTVWPRGRKNV